METLEDFKISRPAVSNFTNESDWTWRDYKFYKTKKASATLSETTRRLPEHINFWPFITIS
jgi:hypothetical protein